MHDRVDLESSVRERYAQGAAAVQPALCCPTIGYDAKYLDILPREIIEKDYGCGDPSAYVRPGETVIDLGSGAGKICYILAQKVGPGGRVIGVDFNDPMLALARKYQTDIAAKLGYDNVRFVKAKIQDMALDLEAAERWLASHPIDTVERLSAFEAECDRLRRESPLVADEAADVVVSNCVLNLVRPADKDRLFAELHRVLKPGGRAVISDIVCDRDPTDRIRHDPDLWSGCIAGAFREDRFLEHFEAAGFYGIEILERQTAAWQRIDGVEFRSMTVRAYRSSPQSCGEENRVVVYTGPFRRVQTEDGHVYQRGQRTAVCDATWRRLTAPNGPYAGHVIDLDMAAEPGAKSSGCCQGGSSCCG